MFKTGRNCALLLLFHSGVLGFPHFDFWSYDIFRYCLDVGKVKLGIPHCGVETPVFAFSRYYVMVGTGGNCAFLDLFLGYFAFPQLVEKTPPRDELGFHVFNLPVNLISCGYGEEQSNHSFR